MGSFLSTNQSMLNTFQELIGLKSGLALTYAQLIEQLEATHSEVETHRYVLGGATKWWQGEDIKPVRIRVENLEANMLYVLHRIGAIPDCLDSMSILRNYLLGEVSLEKRSEDFIGLIGNVSTILNVTDFFPHLLPFPKIDPTIEFIVQKFRESDDFYEFHRRNLINRGLPIQKAWDGYIPLSDLFESEDIPDKVIEGQYFDQRYIDYLNAQTAQLRNIQWRQFEYLTAEYFQRNGYQVKVGPGRGDGGKDVTAKKEDGVAGPDLVLIQCKRYSERNPIDIDTVKAFWTTINEEGATKGLVVTTSKLTSGAKNFCEAHKYRLTAVEYEMVQVWLKNLSSHKLYNA
ncbi:restriction endonuclease [Pantanalinema sp. GBBB05]|uniref:restriction endonuclease n=1 Tax=Pantanalinema sp. GBBB05 TaxID=2604139 RepID=UPI001DB3AECE|nr:restriction endonuclease [Pantanalinema sp. GBBB05]